MADDLEASAGARAQLQSEAEAQWKSPSLWRAIRHDLRDLIARVVRRLIR